MLTILLSTPLTRSSSSDNGKTGETVFLVTKVVQINSKYLILSPISAQVGCWIVLYLCFKKRQFSRN